ncbi:MAG: class I SAM-dependent methyltransferase [Nitrospirae bacterium]|nr:class I SAM-dependent methyltransferase [Nitrospirota bacterium]NTW65993.1 class I SAM-dependent methyltransferase [Nitrospirota bacterium]
MNKPTIISTDPSACNSNRDIACKICSSPVRKFLDVFDDRYGYPGQFWIFDCMGCGHKFLQADFDQDVLTDLYSDYYPRSALRLDQYRPHKPATGFISWLNGKRAGAYTWVPAGVRVLDIGCGFGESLGYHTARNCEVFGVEADENIRRIAETYGFNVHVGLFNPALYEHNYFDYLTMDQVIEHVTDPVSTLRGMEKVLKRGGVAILSTPNANGWGAKVFGRRWINWHAPYHQQWFTLKSMKYAAEQAGLIFDTSRTVTDSEWLFYQWLHLLTYPCMGNPSVFWSPRGIRTIGVKLGFGLLLAMHYTKINHIATRLFDSLGIGDNYVFVLRKP